MKIEGAERSPQHALGALGALWKCEKGRHHQTLGQEKGVGLLQRSCTVKATAVPMMAAVEFIRHMEKVS